MGVLGLFYLAEDTRIVRFFAKYGTMTIFVFVLHPFLIKYLGLAVGLPRRDAIGGAVVSAFIVAASLLVGIHVIRPFFPFLETAPWRLNRRTVVAPV